MRQILTITVLDYFKKIHNATIKCSNAIELLDTIKQFEQMHLSHEDDFKPFRGLNFDSILEYIQQDIYRLQQSHILYSNKGNLITLNTKQRDIEQKNKEYSSKGSVKISTDDLATAINNVFNPPNKKQKTISQTVSKMELKNLKKLNNKK